MEERRWREDEKWEKNKASKQRGIAWRPGRKYVSNLVIVFSLQCWYTVAETCDKPDMFALKGEELSEHGLGCLVGPFISKQTKYNP